MRKSNFRLFILSVFLLFSSIACAGPKVAPPSSEADTAFEEVEEESDFEVSANRETVYWPEERPEITFEWKEPDTGEVHLEIKSPSESLESFSGKGVSELKWPKGPGVYEWRGLHKSKSEEVLEETEWKQVKVLELPPRLPAPQVINPKVEHEILDQI